MPNKRWGIKIIIIAALTAALWVILATFSASNSWLASLSLDSMYWWLDVATFAVIAGVVIEEIPLFLDICKFNRVWRSVGFKKALGLALARWARVAESVGFIILVFGLVYESQLQTLIRDDQTASHSKDEREIADLTKTNLDLEDAISPRFLDQGAFMDAVRQYAGTPVEAISPSEIEPRRTAGYIRWALTHAGWTRAVISSSEHLVFPPGIWVHPGGSVLLRDLPPLTNLSERIQALEKARDRIEYLRRTSEALVEALNANHLKASIGWPVSGDGILIEAGLKPLSDRMQVRMGQLAPGPRARQIWGNIEE
jgi:hypothetical protein